MRITPELSAQLSRTGLSRKAAGDVKYVFVTKAGPGPTRQSAEEHLLDPTSGLPVVPRGLKHRRLRIGDTVESLPSSPPSDMGSNQWLGVSRWVELLVLLSISFAAGSVWARRRSV